MADINVSMNHDELAHIPAFLKKLLSGAGSSPDDSGGSSPDDFGSSTMPPTDNGGDPGAATATGGPSPMAASQPGSDRMLADSGAPPESKLSALQRIIQGQGTANADAAAMTIPDPNIGLGQGQPAVGGLAQSGGHNDAANTPEKQSFMEAHPTLMKILRSGLEFAQDVGPGVGSHTFGEGFQTAAQQPYVRQQMAASATKSRADLADTQSQTNLRNAQANRAGKYSTVSYNGATYEVPNDKLGSFLGQQVGADAKRDVAHISADNKTALADINAQVNAGKIAFVKPIVNDQGQAVLGAYDRQGNLVKTLDKSIGSAWMLPTTRSSVEIKEDGSGGFVYIPKTSTTRRILPVQQGTAPAQAAGTPSAGGGMARPVSSGAVRPIAGPGGTQAGGKISKDAGYAYDPQSGNTLLTTRMEAGSSGLQDFRKVSQKNIDDDRALINRLSDVETKLGRYDDAMAGTALSQADQDRLAYLINSDKFQAHLFGASVPVDEVNNFMRQHQLGSFDNPQAGYRAFAAYNNARESMSGYQRVLSGSGRGSDKTMELNIDALPKPTDPKDFIKEGIAQFRENIPIMRRGLPILPGVNGGRMAQQGQTATSPQTSGGQSVAPEGTIIQNGNQRQIKQGGQWVPYRGQ